MPPTLMSFANASKDATPACSQVTVTLIGTLG
jgi:hypothetical protein